MADMKRLADAITKGDQHAATTITREALAEGMAPASILNKGLIRGMDVVGARFKRNELYIPEVLIAARAMKMSMELLEPELVKADVKPIGRLLIGTVQGDLHDIGKNLVAMMLKGAGFEVADLGVDTPAERFVDHARRTGAQLIGMSAMLTTTMSAMERTLQALKSAGVSARIIVGGAPVTQSYADRIGADGYAAEAASAVYLAKTLLGASNKIIERACKLPIP